MKVLVTGCNGYIGGHLVEALLAEGHDVIGIDHRAEGWQTFEMMGRYRFTRLELADRVAVEPLADSLEGVEAVFHLASHQPYSWDPGPFIYGNVHRTTTVLEAMRLAGVRRLIYSSTQAVYGEPQRVPILETDPVNPRNIYEITKLQAEMLAGVYGELGLFRTAVLRYPSVYGGRNRAGSLHSFVEAALRGEPIRLFAGGRTVRDYVHVDDVVRANLASLGRASEAAIEVFNIGGGDPISTGDLVQLIFELVDRSTEISFAEDEHWRGSDIYLDISKARQLLNYEPRSMRDGIRGYLKTLESAAAAGEP